MGGEKMNKMKVFSIWLGGCWLAAPAAVVIVGRRLRKLLFKWRWGCITLSDVDECVSRSVGRASLSHSSSSFCLSLSIFFQKSSIVLSVYSFTAFCLMMKCCFWNMFLTPFFIYKHQKKPKAGLDHGENGFGSSMGWLSTRGTENVKARFG
jgi:hypothetical protein